MAASLMGFILGALIGGATGTELGIVLGASTGALIGFCVYAFDWARARIGNAPTVERHRAMCRVYGSAAECDFAGDLQTGRWYDVTRCSLLAEPTRVDCDKGCLPLINDARVRPGQACSCHAPGLPPSVR